MKTAVRYNVLVFILLAAAFSLHMLYRQQADIPYNQHLAYRAYLFNYIMAALTGTVLFVFRYRFAASLGFIFFGSSLLKFALFFVFFYPTYHADGDVDKTEFITFFIPYALALIAETRFLVAEMNKL